MRGQADLRRCNCDSRPEASHHIREWVTLWAWEHHVHLPRTDFIGCFSILLEISVNKSRRENKAGKRNKRKESVENYENKQRQCQEEKHRSGHPIGIAQLLASCLLCMLQDATHSALKPTLASLQLHYASLHAADVLIWHEGDLQETDLGARNPSLNLRCALGGDSMISITAFTWVVGGSFRQMPHFV